MHKGRVLFWAVALAACAAAWVYYNKTVRSGPAAARQQTTRVALFAAHDDPFWDIVIAGAQEAAKEFNAKLVVKLPEGEHDSQTNLLTHLPVEEFQASAIRRVWHRVQGLKRAVPAPAVAESGRAGEQDENEGKRCASPASFRLA